MKHQSPRLLAGLVGLALIAGCGSDGTTGVAPVISNLTLDPVTIPRGMATLRASFTVTDPDLDANSFQVRLSGPGGASSNLPSMTVANLAGRTGVPVMVTLSLVLNVAGQYTVEFQVNDAAGHASNRLSGTITAQ